MKPKLPKVWVAVNERGTVLSFGMSKSFLTGLFELREGESIHQYSPVQKPKPKMCKCGDGTFAYSEGYKFCNHCGGKIKSISEQKQNRKRNK